MSSTVVNSSGEIKLPIDLLKRHGLAAHSTVRLVETRQGILLVPITGEEMSTSLAQELAAWQSLGTDSWEQFPDSVKE